MKKWPRIKLLINGFSTGVFVTLFVVTLALGASPFVFVLAAACTGGMALMQLNDNNPI